MRIRRVLLVSRSRGVAQAENFAIEETELSPLAEGQIRVRNAFLSVEPAMRGWIADTGNYSAPVEIGSVMRSLAVGEVVQSNAADFCVGETVMGWFGWQDYADVAPAAVVRRVREADLPASLALGVLGINGVTALIGLEAIGDPKPGETVLVSTAAGAVGSAVGQIAKILGCRTVGVAGGADKTALCRELFGYDATIDYRAPGLREAIDSACPDGVHVYFDNTSGAISDAVWPRLAVRGRVVICGTASISALIDSFVMRSPIGAAFSMSSASARPAPRSFSTGTISLTRPMRRARSALTKRPDSRNSEALETPTSRGNR